MRPSGLEGVVVSMIWRGLPGRLRRHDSTLGNRWESSGIKLQRTAGIWWHSLSERRSCGADRGGKHPDPAITAVPRPTAAMPAPGRVMLVCHDGIHFPARGIIIFYRVPLIGWVLHVAPGGSPTGRQDTDRRRVRNPMDDGRRSGGAAAWARAAHAA